MKIENGWLVELEWEEKEDWDSIEKYCRDEKELLATIEAYLDFFK